MKELELELRKRAIDHMALTLADKPNGTTIRPPPWYRRADDLPSNTPDFSSLIHISRPRIWIKDWDKGHIRPRGQLDDLKQAQFDKAQRELRKKKAPPLPPAAAAAAAAVPRASATAGGSKSNKRKAVEPDESEDEQQQSATELAIRVKKRKAVEPAEGAAEQQQSGTELAALDRINVGVGPQQDPSSFYHAHIRVKMRKSIEADESEAELDIQVQINLKKRRRLAENAPNGDDSAVVSS
ncbi:hypothetical protein V8F33_002685 [Rhypophila sp. PSN 637]